MLQASPVRCEYVCVGVCVLLQEFQAWRLYKLNVYAAYAS